MFLLDSLWRDNLVIVKGMWDSEPSVDNNTAAESQDLLCNDFALGVLICVLSKFMQEMLLKIIRICCQIPFVEM